MAAPSKEQQLAAARALQGQFRSSGTHRGEGQTPFPTRGRGGSHHGPRTRKSPRINTWQALSHADYSPAHALGAPSVRDRPGTLFSYNEFTPGAREHPTTPHPVSDGRVGAYATGRGNENGRRRGLMSSPTKSENERVRAAMTADKMPSPFKAWVETYTVSKTTRGRTINSKKPKFTRPLSPNQEVIDFFNDDDKEVPRGNIFYYQGEYNNPGYVSIVLIQTAQF